MTCDHLCPSVIFPLVRHIEVWHCGSGWCCCSRKVPEPNSHVAFVPLFRNFPSSLTSSSYCVHCLCWNPAALETFEKPCPSLLGQKDRPCHCCSFSPDHYWVCAETLSDITQPEQTASFIEKSQPSPAISVISFCGVRECRSGSSVLSRFHSLVSWGRGCRRDRHSSFPAGGSCFQFVLAKVEPDPWGISPAREQRHKICEVAPTVDRFIWVIERGDVSETSRRSEEENSKFGSGSAIWGKCLMGISQKDFFFHKSVLRI